MSLLSRDAGYRCLPGEAKEKAGLVRDTDPSEILVLISCHLKLHKVWPEMHICPELLSVQTGGQENQVFLPVSVLCDLEQQLCSFPLRSAGGRLPLTPLGSWPPILERQPIPREKLNLVQAPSLHQPPNLSPNERQFPRQPQPWAGHSRVGKTCPSGLAV